MAIGNLILGTGRRSIGDITLYRRNGKQVSRVRNRKVKNPRTQAQYVQRIILQTVSQAYSRMKAICDHSFEGKAVGSSNMSRFMKLNLDFLRKEAAPAMRSGEMDGVSAFVPLNSKLFAPNKYIVSQGSLAPLSFEVSSSGVMGLLNTSADLSSATSYGALINALGLSRGDQITAVAVLGNKAEGSTWQPNVSFAYCRIILDPQTATGAPAELSTPFMTNGVIQMPNSRNLVSGLKFVDFDDSKVLFQGVNSDMKFQAFGVIVSRANGDGSYSYSPCSLAVLEGDNSLYDLYDLATAYRDSLPESSALSKYYLRQAEVQ